MAKLQLAPDCPPALESHAQHIAAQLLARHADGGPETVVFATYEDEREHIQRLLHMMKVQARVGSRLRYLNPTGALWGPDPSGSRHTSTLGVLTPHGASRRLRER